MQPYLFSMSLNNDAYCFDGEILGVNQARRRCLLGEVAREHLRRQRSPASARSPRSTGAGLAVPVAIQYPPVCSSTKSKRIETSRGGHSQPGGEIKGAPSERPKLGKMSLKVLHFRLPCYCSHNGHQRANFLISSFRKQDKPTTSPFHI
jgi:hypothetical protein